MRGMRRHGDKPFIGKKWKPSNADLSVIWSWKRPAIIEAMLSSNRHVLVMERGFIQPRFEWCSLAFDGMNGRGKFAPAGDGGERWERCFAHHLRPWRTEPGDYALLIGQVPNDSALHGQDIVQWVSEQAARLLKLGLPVVYRPHPLHPTPCPEGATLSTGTLEEDFERADRVVTFNSTTAVEAVLAGIPTVISDIGSVAYPMASHEVEEPLVRPDRTAWCHDLAWRQWTIEEFASGEAWEHVKQVLENES
jgi:hypothetical protein